MTVHTDLLRTVGPRQAAAWLKANDWELVNTRPGHTATYRKPAGDESDFVVELPLDQSFRDYARRIAEIIDTLVVASGKPVAWVLAELRSSTFDIIRLRTKGPSIGQGRVPVELGARMFGNARELLLAAACSAHLPRPVYRTRKPNDAMEFLRKVKFAVPEEGSFVVTVLTPVPPVFQTRLLEEMEEEISFERRSTLMLASATVAARQAAQQASLNNDAKPFLDGTAHGISANFCDALAGFVDGEEMTDLEVHFAWASSQLVPKGTPNIVHIGADLSPILKEGARILRTSCSTPDFELKGAVVKLESDNPETGGVAVIAGQIDGQPRKVHVPMEAIDYGHAIRAHEQGQLISCEGELIRKDRRFKLERVRHVTIVADDD